MTDAVRCWLVDRHVDDRNLVTLVYATRDGDRYQKRERSLVSLRNGPPVTAGTTINPSELESVSDAETEARYATEARRIADRHEPDDRL